ncbi:Uncharacterised protein g6850 [Pycnogonum litorale]
MVAAIYLLLVLIIPAFCEFTKRRECPSKTSLVWTRLTETARCPRSNGTLFTVTLYLIPSENLENPVVNGTITQYKPLQTFHYRLYCDVWVNLNTGNKFQFNRSCTLKADNTYQFKAKTCIKSVPYLQKEKKVQYDILHVMVSPKIGVNMFCAEALVTFNLNKTM